MWAVGSSGIGARSVLERFVAEAGAGVADMEDHGAGGADGGDFDDLVGIEGRAMLHGVQQDLAQGLHDLLACVFGDCALSSLAKERRRSAVMRRQLTRTETQPGGRRDIDVISPLVVGRGAAGEVGDLEGIEWRSETGEDAGAEGGDDLVRRAVRGQEDALDAGTDGAHLFEQGEVFFDGAVGAGDDDAEGADAQAVKGIGVASCIVCGEIGSGEKAADLAGHMGLVVNYENSAHGELREPDDQVK